MAAERPRGRHARSPRRGSWVGAAAAVAAAVIVLFAWLAGSGGSDEDPLVEPDPTATLRPEPQAEDTPSPAPTPTPLPTPTVVPTPTTYPGWVDPASSGQPWEAAVEGLLTFRGNPTRTYYGKGPVPAAPRIRWSYPASGAMCGPTSIAGQIETWCGTGWTGQPVVVERDDATWVVFGAYDGAVHFVDADTGAALLPPFRTGDLIKGTVTIDPDGFPLVYIGSRDNYLRVIAIDGTEPVELWRLDGNSVPGRRWNDDWDGSPLVLNDFLFEGGENSIFHIVKLNRGYADDGRVTVDPDLVFTAPGYDQALIARVGTNVSIENSVAVSGNTVYFANSGGLVQGWDIAGLDDGAEPRRVFDYWVGDDVDASVVVDDEGMLIVAVEYERELARSLEVGQIVKLDPSKPDDPLVWSVFDNDYLPAGAWATPAIHEDIVIAPVTSGRIMGIDRQTGEIRWELKLPPPFLWSSPVVVDDVYLQADCGGNRLHAYDLSDTTVAPRELWWYDMPGCMESTPAVWDGRIIVGTRAGQVHMLAD